MLEYEYLIHIHVDVDMRHHLMQLLQTNLNYSYFPCPVGNNNNNDNRREWKKMVDENCNFIYKLICMQIDVMPLSTPRRWSVFCRIFILDESFFLKLHTIDYCDARYLGTIEFDYFGSIYRFIFDFIYQITKRVTMNTNRSIQLVDWLIMYICIQSSAYDTLNFNLNAIDFCFDAI